MKISLTISPTETLPAEKFVQITEKAAKAGVTPDEFVIAAILAALDDQGKEAA